MYTRKHLGPSNVPCGTPRLGCPDGSVLSQEDLKKKKELFKFFKELFAKERSYSSRAKIAR